MTAKKPKANMKELLFLSAVKNRAIMFHYCFSDIPQWPNTNFGWLCFQRFPAVYQIKLKFLRLDF